MEGRGEAGRRGEAEQGGTRWRKAGERMVPWAGQPREGGRSQALAVRPDLNALL